MTTVQLKTEIQKVLDEVPDNVLPDVLNFLKELRQEPDKNIQLAGFLNQTFTEDKELLEKLAQ